MENMELYVAAKTRHKTKDGHINDFDCVIEQEKEIRYYREKIKSLVKALKLNEAQLESQSYVEVEVQCRTIHEAKKVIDEFKDYDIDLRIFVDNKMLEIV